MLCSFGSPVGVGEKNNESNMVCHVGACYDFANAFLFLAPLFGVLSGWLMLGEIVK
ncbi:hypothetical protein [Paenibacillus uliginis]|uniref:hypothetical protein n=1 Tax=Paenibacillus uliginis TaxID=683737 RepID=UPI001AEC8F1B|nr:hypothetical protein [Paenibacillus uliginis]